MVARSASCEGIDETPQEGSGVERSLKRLTQVMKGFRESRRCSRDTYPESCIIESILIYEGKAVTIR